MAVLAVVFFVSAIRGNTGGTITDKQVVTERNCSNLTCGARACFQLSYVTDNGSRELACVPKEEYDTLKVGDRYEP